METAAHRIGLIQHSTEARENRFFFPPVEWIDAKVLVLSVGYMTVERNETVEIINSDIKR